MFVVHHEWRSRHDFTATDPTSCTLHAAVEGASSRCSQLRTAASLGPTYIDSSRNSPVGKDFSPPCPVQIVSSRFMRPYESRPERVSRFKGRTDLIENFEANKDVVGDLEHTSLPPVPGPTLHLACCAILALDLRLGDSNSIRSLQGEIRARHLPFSALIANIASPVQRNPPQRSNRGYFT